MLKRLSDECAATDKHRQLESGVDARLELVANPVAHLGPGSAGEGSWFGTDAQAFLVSLLFHVVLILGLAVVPILVTTEETLTLLALAPIEEELTLIEEVAISEEPSTEVGANSESGDGLALSTAPVLADLSEIPSPSFDPPAVNATFDLSNQIEQAMGLVRSDVVVKGMTGVGTTGTDGAVDRITYEILRSMEERPTLVVWFFDQSGSLQRQREEIRNRFERIYEELGIVASAKQSRAKQANAKKESANEKSAKQESANEKSSSVEGAQEQSGEEEDTQEPRSDSEEQLLTSVFAFGSQVNLLTSKPTADIHEIRAAIDSIQQDDTGIERVFAALYKGVEKFKSYRTNRSGRGAERNVMFIAVTDERGDDAHGLDVTLRDCRRYAIPVYVIGVPAPFGRDVTYVKYVDPDPKFDQTPQWAQVDQGPESIWPERVRLGYRDDYYSEPVVDSGFGPYALSRLTYETGGIYFAVHPNRSVGRKVRRGEIDPFASNLEYFFDPEVMVKYRPDYVSAAEYEERVSESPLRQILVLAAKMPRVDTLQKPTLQFVKRDEASLANALTQAQQQAARVDPQLEELAQVLRPGEDQRDKEASPRWLAGFDLALGTVLAHMVRAKAYNEMLAKAKRGMNFVDSKNNTWVLQPSPEISVGSRLEKEGEQARELLQQVAEKHKGTPWGLLASRELETPVGWKWTEQYTDLKPPAARNPGNNNNTPRPPRDDEKRMLAPPPPKRPVPKL